MLRHSTQSLSIDQSHYYSRLAEAFQAVPVAPAVSSLCQWACLLEATSRGEGRLFHNSDHVLQLCEGTDGLGALAALFHDSVYIQIDDGLHPQVEDRLAPFLIRKNNTLYVRSLADLQQYRGGALVAALFGFQHQVPQLACQHNEFLSALLAIQCLQSELSWGALAQIAIAIEATIPFRPILQDSSPTEKLFERLMQSNCRFGLGLSPSTLTTAIHRAVALANRDVADFALQDPAVFLARTWRLLPEFNPALRSPQSYSVQDYREAILRMERFFLTLNPNTVFQQFRHFPEAESYRGWQHQAQHNLAVGHLYLKAKIVAIALLEALGAYRGALSASPMADWLRSRRGEPPWEESFEYNLAQSPTPATRPMTSAAQCHALQVARAGRAGDCSFDMRRSPLAAFLISTLGFERLDLLRSQADLFFEQRLGPDQFLGLFDSTIIEPLSQRLLP